MSNVIHVVNPVERSWTRHRYVLWFGAYGDTRLMVWANDLDSALEECAEWLAEHVPGLIMAHGSPEHVDLLQEACKEHGMTWELYKAGDWCGDVSAVTNDAEADLTYTESGFINSWEWGICLEDPSRMVLMDFAAACGATFRYQVGK